ncbi:MAG: helix-turn-helix transcriptional regulator [Treponema sp.]|nr:helix-turn-helix transcriptional regulator [Treponema sp.]
MDMNQLFILNLKKWRKIKGISQEKLAEKCGAAHSYVRQLESGNRCPSFSFIGKLAKALGIEPYQLFFDETAKPAKSARTKQMESVQKKLLESLSNNICLAFDELKKY